MLNLYASASERNAARMPHTPCRNMGTCGTSLARMVMRNRSIAVSSIAVVGTVRDWNVAFIFRAAARQYPSRSCDTREQPMRNRTRSARHSSQFGRRCNGRLRCADRSTFVACHRYSKGRLLRFAKEPMSTSRQAHDWRRRHQRVHGQVATATAFRFYKTVR